VPAPLRRRLHRWWYREHDITIEPVDDGFLVSVDGDEPSMLDAKNAQLTELLAMTGGGTRTGVFQHLRWPTRLWGRLVRNRRDDMIP
jgi:hypothetical protein